MREHHLVLACERVELVRRRQEGVAQQLGDLLRRQVAERRRGVESGADGRASGSESPEWLQRGNDHLLITFQSCSPAGDLLGETQRNRVLQMRPSAFQNVPVFFFKAAQGRGKAVQRR